MSFRWKTILGIAFIEVVFLSLLIWQALSFLETSAEKAVLKRANDTVQLASSVLLDALISYDLASLKEQVEQIGSLEGVHYAQLQGYERILVSVGAQPETLSAQDYDVGSVDDGIFDVRSDLAVGDQVLGTLYLGFSIEELKSLAAQANVRLYTIAGLELVLVALCSLVLANFLTKRILDLRDASQKLQAGALGESIPVTGNDELAETMEAFNSMSRILKERERALEQSNAALQIANSRLQERETEIKSLFRAAPDGFAMLDSRWRVVLANKAMETMTELSEADLSDRQLVEVLSSLDVENAERFQADRMTLGSRIDFSLRCQSGRRVYAQASVVPFAAGDKDMFVLTLRDRTQEQELERSVRISERLKANLFDCSLDALITINKEGHVTDFSQSAEVLFGWKREELIGQPMAQYLIPEDLRSAHNKGMAHFLATGEGPLIGKRVETMALRRTGETFPVELALTAIEVDDEIFVNAALRDISERKVWERQLLNSKAEAEQASQAKSRFLSYMSHEIRSPLNAVLGSLSLLEERVQLNDHGSRYLALAQRSGDALLAVVNEILDFSKIEAGYISFNRRDFDVRQLLNDVQEGIRAQHSNPDVDLGCTIDESLPELIKADPNHLRQILTILLDNACKFTHEGRVWVEVTCAAQVDGETDEWACIEVSDTGAGIPEDLVDTIFSEFEQVDAMRDSGYGGSGLGLAIARKLLDGMGGSIAVKSKVGVGTTFTVKFPFGKADETAEPDQAHYNQVPVDDPQCDVEDEASHPAPGKRVLLVDDVEANLLIGSEMLQGRGYSVDTAKDGIEACERAAERQYAVILMDMRMPRLNGLEASARIQQSGGLNASTPIIALTANAETSEIDRCLKGGMCDFISKPFKIDRLVNAIEQCATETRGTTMEPSKPQASQPEIMSMEVLDQLAADTSPETIPMMISVFINEVKKRLQHIENASVKNDEDEIREQAHALKSCAGTFGGLHLQSIAKQVEDAAIGHAAGSDQALLELLQTVAEQTLMKYSQYYEQLQQTPEQSL
ncbi:PAS domain S-box protein [Marinobacter salinisoli]|uniref:histidine kinase n=1 Tax=Marinobacter salinisoli TaxID=2769486 RepID=A0ABX7MP13_9GAMM|nr:PAS domain S-box protein [Marinobacter salinisoli]QSP93969.1 PAS domain S-box protein [Marinobacter salinisoli]